MNTSLLTISKPLEPTRHDVFSRLCQATAKLQIHFMLVGAFVRDVWLHQLHGLPVERMTMDTDFGVKVDSWADYEQLRMELMNSHGFTADRNPAHPEKLYRPGNVQLDLLPFGGVVGKNGTILWPADNSEMNMLGFDFRSLLGGRFENAVMLLSALQRGLEDGQAVILPDSKHR
jgi:predicted nucleotidyltransferase